MSQIQAQFHTSNKIDCRGVAERQEKLAHSASCGARREKNPEPHRGGALFEGDAHFRGSVQKNGWKIFRVMSDEIPANNKPDARCSEITH